MSYDATRKRQCYRTRVSGNQHAVKSGRFSACRLPGEAARLVEAISRPLTARPTRARRPRAIDYPIRSGQGMTLGPQGCAQNRIPNASFCQGWIRCVRSLPPGHHHPQRRHTCTHWRAQLHQPLHRRGAALLQACTYFQGKVWVMANCSFFFGL